MRARADLVHLARVLVAALSLSFVSSAARAQAPADTAVESEAAGDPEPPQEPREDPKVVRARALYKQGVRQVKKTQWGDALVAFEKSYALRPHARTSFNIGLCERAMGSYTRARETFRRALSESERRGGELSSSLVAEARGYVSEIGRLVARVQVTLDTPGASIAVDGRPLRVVAGKRAVLLAGVEPPGKGRATRTRRFELVLNPGAHVITLSRKGYTDAVVNKSYAPGARTTLLLELEKLPATLRVSSNVAGAIVTLNGKDFGPAPVSVLRPAGNYELIVAREGYESYEAQVKVQPGEEAVLEAKLIEETTQVTERWWFWTGAAVLLIGAGVTTYALTRPEPDPPPYEGGSTGWIVFPTGN